MKVLWATYGGKDVTKTVANKVKSDRLVIKASNSVFGDLSPGVKKSLQVMTDVGFFTAEENGWLMAPKSKHKRAGVWYSNNNHEGTNKASLMNLQKLRGGDIYTSVWEPISGNPFPEFVSPYKVSSHLNIAIQVLGLLYVLKQTGDYDYVSFLEHDVLYPADYFEIEIPEGAKIVSNMNYHGICPTGFQKRMADHEPLHQLTMEVGFAIAHFERLVLSCIQSGGGGLVEPNDKKVTVYSKGKAIHVNHGKNFTSHYSIYSKETTQQDEEWGSAEELIKCLNI